MSCGLTHLVLPVADPARSAAFYREGAGFAETSGPEPREVEGHGLTLRLVPGVPARGLTLRLQTTDVESAADRLVAAGARWNRAPENGPAERTARLCDPDGYGLELWRRLRESELGEPPTLPTRLVWSSEARARATVLLALVPEEFRDLARNGLVAEAEYLGVTAPEIAPDLVLRAYVRSTPRLLRARLYRPLVDLGFDLAPCREDFEC